MTRRAPVAPNGWPIAREPLNAHKGVEWEHNERESQGARRDGAGRRKRDRETETATGVERDRERQTR